MSLEVCEVKILRFFSWIISSFGRKTFLGEIHLAQYPAKFIALTAEPVYTMRCVRL